jgi:hypothetical protein
MARKKQVTTVRAEAKRRRVPRTRVAGRTVVKRNRRNTLTLQQFEAALRETTSSMATRFDGDGNPVEDEYEPARAQGWARRRAAAEKGDLLATYTALEWCGVDWRGWPVVDTSNPDPEKLVEIPVWLLRALQKLIYRGMHGMWPTRKGRLSTDANRFWANRTHLNRAHWVLRARQAGSPWDTVFEDASDLLKEKHGKRIPPGTLEASYLKIVRAFRSGELERLWHSPTWPIPEEWKL